jgi:hypothetical protein
VLYADRVLRPLFLRLLITFLPPAVFIRARNPIFFLRRRTLGWYVRLVLAIIVALDAVEYVSF